MTALGAPPPVLVDKSVAPLKAQLRPFYSSDLKEHMKKFFRKKKKINELNALYNMEPKCIPTQKLWLKSCLCCRLALADVHVIKGFDDHTQNEASWRFLHVSGLNPV